MCAEFGVLYVTLCDDIAPQHPHPCGYLCIRVNYTERTSGGKVLKFTFEKSTKSLKSIQIAWDVLNGSERWNKGRQLKRTIQPCQRMQAATPNQEISFCQNLSHMVTNSVNWRPRRSIASGEARQLLRKRTDSLFCSASRDLLGRICPLWSDVPRSRHQSVVWRRWDKEDRGSWHHLIYITGPDPKYHPLCFYCED